MHSDVIGRPARSTVLREHQSVIEAPLSAVLARLAAVVDPGEQSSFAVDETAGLVVVQGGWWYRAEYRVAADPAGTRVTLTILNVAQPAHWAGPITGRAALRSSAQDFGAVIAAVRAAL
jgi:hypothetical protein